MRVAKITTSKELLEPEAGRKHPAEETAVTQEAGVFEQQTGTTQSRQLQRRK